MRSSTQVSCLFGKKRLIVKKGDWLVRTASGWRNLRRAEEIEDCLYHRLKGELFIFDSIEKEQGKWTMHGHLFDIQRYFATPVSLPIDSEKKSSQRHFKKIFTPTRSIIDVENIFAQHRSYFQLHER